MEHHTALNFWVRITSFMHKDDHKENKVEEESAYKSEQLTAKVIHLYQHDTPITQPAKIIPMFS